MTKQKDEEQAQAQSNASVESSASVESDLARKLNEAQQVPALGALHAQADELAKDIVRRENELAGRRRVALEARQKFEAEQRRLADDKVQRAESERTIPVIVQTRKDRDVRLSTYAAIPSRKPVMVNRRELRQLEGMRRQGTVQLIVGKLEKPGGVTKLEKGDHVTSH